jgi:hypothetical protein
VRDTGEQMGFDHGERRGGRGSRVQNTSECIKRCLGVSLRQEDHRASVVNGAHLPVVNETNLLWLAGESGQSRPRLVGDPKPSLRRREPSRDPRRERVHAAELRFHPSRRGKCFKR